MYKLKNNLFPEYYKKLTEIIKNDPKYEDTKKFKELGLDRDWIILLNRKGLPKRYIVKDHPEIKNPFLINKLMDVDSWLSMANYKTGVGMMYCLDFCTEPSEGASVTVIENAIPILPTAEFISESSCGHKFIEHQVADYDTTVNIHRLINPPEDSAHGVDKKTATGNRFRDISEILLDIGETILTHNLAAMFPQAILPGVEFESSYKLVFNQHT